MVRVSGAAATDAWTLAPSATAAAAKARTTLSALRRPQLCIQTSLTSRAANRNTRRLPAGVPPRGIYKDVATALFVSVGGRGPGRPGHAKRSRLRDDQPKPGA